MLIWNEKDNLGRAGDSQLMTDVGSKPALSFDFDTLYYEPDTNVRFKIFNGIQTDLTDAECSACEDAIKEIVANADYPVQAYDSDGIFKGTILKSEAETQKLGWCLDKPDHPASKRVDDTWERVVAVIRDTGILIEMPESICQLCLLTFTQKEWDAFPTRPKTPHETWDFVKEIWRDKRTLAETQAEAEELVRRVFNGIREKWIGKTPALERMTWAVQEAEARAWLTSEDESAETPFIDKALEGRSIAKKDFCLDVLANAQNAWNTLALIHNQHWLWLDKVRACTTPQEVDKIVFDLGNIKLFDTLEA